MGGGAFSGSDGMADAKLIGAVIGASLAVATAISVLCSDNTPPSGNEHGTPSNNTLMTTFKESVPCASISKKMAKCLEGNAYDITKCVVYFDLLKEAEKPKNEAEKSGKKEADKAGKR